MGNTDLGVVLIFTLGWVFALNIKNVADRVYETASRFAPVIGTSFALRLMGWIWIFVGGVFIVTGFVE